MTPVVTAKEAVQLGKVINQCFNLPPEVWGTYVQRLGRQNLRVVRQAESIIGGVALYPMGQWFGGATIPMTGLAAVGIAPEQRGTGAAAHLLTQTLRELQNEGISLATLYASTSRLYRSVGFEQAGAYCRFCVPLPTLSQVNSPYTGTDPRALPMTGVDIHELHRLMPLYNQRAQTTNGNLNRHEAIWQHIFHSAEVTVYADLIGPSDRPEGYVIFDQQKISGGYALRIRDLVVLTKTAAQRFWTFMADHRSLARQVSWYGPTLDPLLALLPEQTYRIEQLERWLLRLVNVPKALALRGYPLGIETELHLEVHESTVPQQHRPLCAAGREGSGSGRFRGARRFTPGYPRVVAALHGLIHAPAVTNPRVLSGD